MGTSIGYANAPVSPGQANGLLAKVLGVEMNPTVGVFEYTAPNGTVSPGDTITGTSSGAVGTVLTNDGGTQKIRYTVVSGTFDTSDVAVGPSGDVTVATTYYDDTPITLLGGSQFQITNMTIMNPTTNMNLVADAQIWTGPNRTGSLLFLSNVFAQENLRVLQNPNNYIDTFSGGFPHTPCWPPPCIGQIILTSSIIYYSVTVRQEDVTAFVDIYAYGDVIS